MSRYGLNKAMYEATVPVAAERFHSDRGAFLAGYALTADERRALTVPDFHAILAAGGLPNLVYRYFRLHGLPAGEFRPRVAAEAVRASDPSGA